MVKVKPVSCGHLGEVSFNYHQRGQEGRRAANTLQVGITNLASLEMKSKKIPELSINSLKNTVERGKGGTNLDWTIPLSVR